jgi:hypothetical protein
MTDEAKSPLRRRMIEDMTIRKFAPKTQHDYVQRVSGDHNPRDQLEQVFGRCGHDGEAADAAVLDLLRRSTLL